MSPKKPLVYPYRWGVGIVNTFVEKYARATYNFAKCVDLSPGEVRHFLILSLCRGNSLQFEAFKRTVKVMGDYTAEDLARYSPAQKKQLNKWLVYMNQEDVMNEKDERLLLDRAQNFELDL